MSNISHLRQYLDENGKLAWGTQAQIDTLKKEKRKRYMRAYKRKRRKEYKEITITLKPQEKKDLQQQAKDYGLSLPQFILQSSQCYLQQTYLIPDPDKVAKLELLLSLWQTDMKRLMQYEDHMFTVKIIQQRLSILEKLVSGMLRNPQLFSNIPTPKHDHQNTQ